MNPTIENTAQSRAHILVVSCPFQGHVAPLMKLSHQITDFGARVTFLSVTSTAELESWNPRIRLILIPNGLEPENGWLDPNNLLECAHKLIPGRFEDLLKKTNQPDGNANERISGVIFDAPLSYMMEIPKKMGIKVAAFWVSSPGCLALGLKIPQLLEEGVIDSDGTPIHGKSIQLHPNMPAMAPGDLMWHFPVDINVQKSIFEVVKGTVHHMVHADWILCNWFDQLSPSVHDLAGNLLPVGPLLSKGQSSGSFCPEDPTCLSWLDQQPPGSVVYVAFGSTPTFSQHQLDELAHGLELMGQPYLWVAWPGLTRGQSSPSNYMGKKGGKIVEWAPQEAVLGHPSVGCFLTHCGWGSFVEAVSEGVPLVCWPYFGDQMYTRTCICEAWRVGVGLRVGGAAMVERDEVKRKVDEVFDDRVLRENASRLKEMARSNGGRGGSSLSNLEYLVEQMTL